MSKPRGLIKVAKCDGPNDVGQLTNADYIMLGKVQQTRMFCGLKKFIHAEGMGSGWWPYELEDKNEFCIQTRGVVSGDMVTLLTLRRCRYKIGTNGKGRIIYNNSAIFFLGGEGG